MRCRENEEPKCTKYKEEVKPAKPPTNCVSWFDGCNNCSVRDNGLLMCTKMFCETTKTPKCTAYRTPDENCTKWYDGCNECSVRNGKIGACTEMACFVQSESKCLEDKTKPEKPVSRIPEGCTGWFDGCNSCGVENG